MSKTTIETATKKIQCLKRKIERLRLDNRLLKSKIDNGESLVEEARKIICAINTITHAVNRN